MPATTTTKLCDDCLPNASGRDDAYQHYDPPYGGARGGGLGPMHVSGVSGHSHQPWGHGAAPDIGGPLHPDFTVSSGPNRYRGLGEEGGHAASRNGGLSWKCKLGLNHCKRHHINTTEVILCKAAHCLALQRIIVVVITSVFLECLSV